MAKGMRWTEEDLQAHIKRNAKQILSGEAKASKPSKYRNKKTTVDGIEFDSAKEARRWQELQLLKSTGCIFGLSRQEKFSIDINRQHICDYVADFVYANSAGQVVEDVKSEATRKLPVYRLKKKLMKAVHGIDIQEV
jgi:hypothetical protein